MGTEQEYGIVMPGVDPAAAPHPSTLSNLVISAWPHGLGAGGFDLDGETPLVDQYGFELARAEAGTDLLTDEVTGLANRMLTNGARFYVDHAHPEFSSPEVVTAHDAAVYDRAGDMIMAVAAQRASTEIDQPVRLFKNNVDGKGAAWGSHENYRIPRAIAFDDVVAGIVPHLVSRGVITGAGRVGIGSTSQRAGYQLMQRADYLERVVGLETTVRRPIVNTRDEPHADRLRWRRLHVITGDANQSQTAVLVKVGAMALVLGALAAGRLPAITLRDPVAAVRVLSRDLSLRVTVDLDDGRSLTGLDIQETLWEACRDFADDHPHHLPDAAVVLEAWRRLIDDLRADPMRAADRCDWVAKLRLLQRYRDRDGLGWDAPLLAAVDLQYAEIDPTRSLALALERKGLLRTIAGGDELDRATRQPPQQTRAWLRGFFVSDFPDQVVTMNWDSVVVTDGPRRVVGRLNDPLRGTKHELDALGDIGSAAEALRRLDL